MIPFRNRAFGVVSKKSLPYPRSSKFSSMFSSRSFIVLCLPFRSMIHFEVIFVKGVRSVSSFICLHVAVQLFQHHVLKRLSLSHCVAFASFVNDQLSIFLWVYFWVVYSVLLIGLSIFLPVSHCPGYCSFRVSCDVGWCQSSNFVVLDRKSVV